LAVADGDAVINPILRIAPAFEHIVLTQDWHPAGHSSFASSHAGKQPFEQIELNYGTQTLWPEHCVQQTHGAEFHPTLGLPQAELILRKGFRLQIDSYSAFFENDRQTPTGLAGYLRERSLTRVFLAGLAYDFCVGYSALDARRLGFQAVVLRDACRAINLNGSVAKIEAEFSQAGVKLIESAALFG
jgi:nicotinamidase/pyrazinamidase